MGRGGRGGRSPTPNDDRSRSMNLQDVCGQAAAANTARQLRGNEEDYDDGYDDGKGKRARAPYVTINDEDKHDNSHWGVYRDEPEKPQKPKPALTHADLGFYGPLMHLKIKPKSEDK